MGSTESGECGRCCAGEAKQELTYFQHGAEVDRVNLGEQPLACRTRDLGAGAAHVQVFREVVGVDDFGNMKLQDPRGKLTDGFVSRSFYVFREKPTKKIKPPSLKDQAMRMDRHQCPHCYHYLAEGRLFCSFCHMKCLESEALEQAFGDGPDVPPWCPHAEGHKEMHRTALKQQRMEEKGFVRAVGGKQVHWRPPLVKNQAPTHLLCAAFDDFDDEMEEFAKDVISAPPRPV